MRSTKYDPALLAPVVQSSRSLAEVMRKLGLPTTGGNHRFITARIRLAAIDISHFGSTTIAARCAAVSRDSLEALAQRCTSIAQVLAALSLPTEGRAHRELTRRLRQLQIDTSHFRGRGWSRGERRSTHASVERVSRSNTRLDADVFVENSPHANSRDLVPRLLAMGWPYRCSSCDLVEWQGHPLVLHLDHINGINNDHRLSNLRLLCPNCHSQTETYCRRARRSRL